MVITPYDALSLVADDEVIDIEHPIKSVNEHHDTDGVEISAQELPQTDENNVAPGASLPAEAPHIINFPRKNMNAPPSGETTRVTKKPVWIKDYDLPVEAPQENILWKIISLIMVLLHLITTIFLNFSTLC